MWRVLIVDDSKSIRGALQAVIEPYGLEIEHADHGGQALAKMKAAPFDLIFLDINMPVLDGPTLLRMMRAANVKAKVVLVTASGDTPTLTAAIKLGASDYISKPFTPERIQAVLARELGADAKLEVRPARVLLQHTDDTLPQQLRARLPAYVGLDTAPTLARALELAEGGIHSLVLLDTALLDPTVLTEEVAAIAGLIRARLPAAGIFAVTAQPPPGSAFAPDGALDGFLARVFDDELVHDYLYLNFLRPLVFTRGIKVRAAGFSGEAKNQPVYFTMLARALRAACVTVGATQDLSIDLSCVPLEVEPLTALIVEVNAALCALGAAPSFRLSKAAQAALSSRAELARVPLFS